MYATVEKQLLSEIRTKGLAIIDWGDYVWEHNVTLATIIVDTAKPWQDVLRRGIDSLVTRLLHIRSIYITVSHDNNRFLFKLHCCSPSVSPAQSVPLSNDSVQKWEKGIK